MILHILPDEKIINRTIETFETVFPKNNKFLVFSSNGNCKYVDKTDCVFVTKEGDNTFWEYVGDVSLYKSIVIHRLDKFSIRFINSINHNRIYWIEWGVDLFVNLLEPRGYKIYYDDDMYKYVYPSLKRRLAHKYLRLLFPSRDTIRAIKKIKYFVPDSMYDEYPLLLHYYPQFSHLEYKEFFYYPIDQVVESSMFNERCIGDNIIVGNSGSFSGNHLEVINILSKIDLGQRKVRFSLSYGGSKSYLAKIVCEGKAKMGDAFDAITDYLPLAEYNKVLLDASYFIYNNYRQEAVGNILVALFFGGKVFLSDRSPLLTFYKRLGLILFGISEINYEMLNTPLQESIINQNREIIKKHYSLERLYQLVKDNFE